LNSKITPELLENLIQIVGKKNIIEKGTELKEFSHDETAAYVAITQIPDIVVKPGTSEEVAKVLKLAYENLVPVTPRGAGTGLSGGAVPIKGGIVLSLDRLNKIIEIDENDLMMTVESGVPLLKIYEALEDTDLFFPPHPGDESAHIGAAIATNAGGVRTLKYGVMRNFVKGAEVVLPTGKIVNLSGKLLKDNTGYNLLQLLIGSEGTLAIFTKVTLRLLPKPKEMMILIMEYEDVNSAISTVPKLLKTGEIPLGLEYVEREGITPTEKMLGEVWPAKGQAFLMVVVVGNKKDELYSICEKIAAVGEENGAKDVLLADKKKEQEVIMRIRSNLYEGLKPEMIDLLDIAVPPSKIAKFVEKVKIISSKNKVKLPVYGHAGDGNVHIHIMKEGLGNDWRQKYEYIKKEIFEAGRTLGGVITAEHGIGIQKINDLHYSLSKEEIELMKAIKEIFDPRNILNPGKVLPENGSNPKSIK
jgi:glycolate oxidase